MKNQIQLVTKKHEQGYRLNVWHEGTSWQKCKKQCRNPHQAQIYLYSRIREQSWRNATTRFNLWLWFIISFVLHASWTPANTLRTKLDISHSDRLNFKHPCSILSAIRALALGVMKAFLFVVPGVDFCIVSCIFGKIFLCVKHLIDSLVHVF